jgi:hypothetical protein
VGLLVMQSVCTAPPLIIFEPVGRFSRNSAGGGHAIKVYLEDIIFNVVPLIVSKMSVFQTSEVHDNLY